MALTALEISARGTVAGGMTFGEVGHYEQLDGTARFAVDPEHRANAAITDLQLAPRDSDGFVLFSADMSILKPVESRRGNHRILLDVLNRGRRRALKYFNAAQDVPDPNAPIDPGNGFLMSQGYTLVWCGWQHDVPTVKGLLGLKVPEATGPDGPISGKIVVKFQPNVPIKVQPLSDAMHRPYPIVDVNDPEATLLVRDYDDGPPRKVPRDEWSFARLEDKRVMPDQSHIYMAAGFQPGKVYQVIYPTAGAPVVGLGFAATRDLVSFLKHGTDAQGNPCAADVEFAYGFGASQSGRFLRPHIAGGRMGEFNQRFGQPSTSWKQSMGCLFPFADTSQTDPETERTDALLAKLTDMGRVPKILFSNSSAEYWRGDASLIHTDASATNDLTPSESVRIYHFAGTQHSSGIYPPTERTPGDGFRGQHQLNCVDYTPLLRAVLSNLDRWVTSGEAPPPSKHPLLADGTAVPADRVAATVRAFPGVNSPTHLPNLTRLDFGSESEPGIPSQVPPVVGNVYPSFVSAVDEDGNELAGIRLPDVSVPLATHTGWNLRHAEIGGAGEIMDISGLFGSSIPFPATRIERDASGDPRPSIEERYASKAEYLRRVRVAAQALVGEGYLLEGDIETVVSQAAEHYALFGGTAADRRA